MNIISCIKTKREVIEFFDCIIKDEKWYVDEVSDTAMMIVATSLFG